MNKVMNIIRLTEGDLHNIIKESINKILIKENSLDKKINKLIGYVYQTNDFDLIRKKRANFLLTFPNARARNSKWLYRVLQWYYDDEIPFNEQSLLNRFLGYLHKNEYPDEAINNTDWSSLSFNDIRNAYLSLYSNGNEQTNNLDAKQVQEINGYVIKRYDSQEELRAESSEYNYEWCIIDGMFDEMCYSSTCYIVKNKQTYNKAHYTTVEEIIQMLRNYGEDELADNLYENIKDMDPYDLQNEDVADLTTWGYIDEYMDIAEENPSLKLPPYDNCGLSAFVVLVGKDGRLDECYSRYNMPDMCDGRFLDEEQICNLLGISNFSEVFPYVPKGNKNKQ